MGIDRKEVEHVALLARLKLSDDEIDRFTDQLGGILDYVKKLEEVDTSDVPPMSHAIEAANVWREDAIQTSLTVPDALANAPEQEDVFFKAPKVTE